MKDLLTFNNCKWVVAEGWEANDPTFRRFFQCSWLLDQTDALAARDNF